MRRFRLAFSAVLSATFAANGCGGGAVGPDPQLTVETDKPAYSLATDSFVHITLTNRTDSPIYVPMGSYLAYERLVAGEWRDLFQWFIVDGIGRSFTLAGGDARTDVLEVWYYLAGRPGTYRFQYWIYADPGLSRLLPLEDRVSVPFEVTP
jgi:hypothetical protein